MDVALDANEFLSDPRMESVRFQSLLSYLRKTQSRLIIPKIVWDEVIARYPERISGPYGKAITDLKTLRSLLLSTKIPSMAQLDVAREIQALKGKLKKPSTHVSSKVLNNFSAVPLEEVAKRGIDRIPPANSKGEELRDVIVWLMMVAYARKSKQDIAFISHDEHFRQGDALHPELNKDLEHGKIKLHFYRSIDDFIKAWAPSPRALGEDESFLLLGKQNALDLFEIEARRLFPRYWGSATIQVQDRKITFSKGALYDVGSSAHYGEMEFLGELQLNVVESERSQYFLSSKSTVPDFVLGSPTRLLEPEMSTMPVAQFRLDSVPTFDSAQIKWYPASFLVDSWASNQVAAKSAPAFDTMTTTTQVRVSGKLAIAIRTVSDKVTKVEVEGFELTKREEIAATAEISAE